MAPGLSYRPDDEHMNVPTWRMKQLQDVEYAARQAVELLHTKTRGYPRTPLEREVLDLLTEALGDD